MPRPATGAPSRAQERGIEQVWAIRRADDKHVRPTTVTARHPVELCEQLAHDSIHYAARVAVVPALRRDRVELVEEDDTRPRIACPLEHAPHVRLRLANVHVQ